MKPGFKVDQDIRVNLMQAVIDSQLDGWSVLCSQNLVLSLTDDYLNIRILRSNPLHKLLGPNIVHELSLQWVGSGVADDQELKVRLTSLQVRGLDLPCELKTLWQLHLSLHRCLFVNVSERANQRKSLKKSQIGGSPQERLLQITNRRACGK